MPLEVPGILNASLDDGRIELQRVPTDSLKVGETNEESLRRLLGEYTLVESKNKIAPDQVQLIGAVMTIPLLTLYSPLKW